MARRNLRNRSFLPLLALGVVFFSASECYATDYYVSWRAGSDENNGLSVDTPWKSIARVNRGKFHPGDQILLHAGETWREQLRPPSSGSVDSPIVFTSYGTGSRPILDGSRVSEANISIRPSKAAKEKSREGDVAIDNNNQSHIVYKSLSLHHVLEGLRIYAWASTVRDITLQDCWIQVEDAANASVSSAAVYANVHTGSIVDLRIQNNRIVPYPRRLEHWGVYFVSGVEHFEITGNTLGPAGEDGITIWHSAYGEISRNQGGGNGENTIDVKDSHDIEIRDNDADLDREYNVVVHSVDSPSSTYSVRVTGNRCSRGGQGGELSAGIALLFVQKSGIEDNVVDFAYGSGILIKDTEPHPGNWAARNRLTGNGTGQKLPAIVLQGSSTARVEGNYIVPAIQ